MAFSANFTYAQWINPPSEQQREEIPGLVHEVYHSPAMNRDVGYSVVLPPSYHEGQRRYPVVYMLHGGGRNESSFLFTAGYWSELYKSKQVEEVILVYPCGFRSGYMDHYDGKVMVESMIVREIIPRIDQQYRTINSRNARAVHGFSMGASGSLKFVIKYPELFCAAVAYGGGAIDLENSTDPFILKILKRNLNSNQDLIRQNNTYHMLEKNHALVRKNDIKFLLICGEEDSWKQSAVTFQQVLLRKQLDSQLKLVPKIKHEMPRLFLAVGRQAVIFQDQVFKAKLQHDSDAQ